MQRTSLKYALGVLIYLLVAVNAGAEEKLLDQVIAVVDDGVILQSQLETRMQQVKSRLRAQGTMPPPDSVLRGRVLDKLILDTIQLQKADEVGMNISDTELNDTMRKIAASNNYTLDEFEQALASEGVTYRQAREQIREEMLINRIQHRTVEPRVRVTDREVQNYLESAAGRKQTGAEYLVGHILFAVEDKRDEAQLEAARKQAEQVLEQLRDGADFKQMAVAHSDGRNALEGGVLGWRSEDQLPSLIADVAPDLAIKEPSKILKSPSGFHIVTVLDKRGGAKKEVQQTRARHILVKTGAVTTAAEAEEKIRDIQKQLDNGAGFAELARAQSDDPVSGSSGGDLGWINPGEMVPAFEKAMKQTPVGQRSEPFRSKFGWHILEVEDRRMHDIGEQLQEAEAKQAIFRRKFETELQIWLREIREEAFVEIKEPELRKAINS
ncbi:peptidylprolyl isomerase [Marinobacteraceae bacterium S3BR75-40.1]